MALLDHLQSFTWVTWINDRVYHTRGSDSTRHHNAGQGCAQGSWNRKALVRLCDTKQVGKLLLQPKSQSMMWWTVVVEVYDLPQIDAAGNTTTKFSHVFASM
jgi:hypothetical protein